MEVRFLVGNLVKLQVDAIVNPANSEGEMGGGVAAAIRRSGGKQIERAAMEHAPIPIGEAVVTTSGRLPCDYVVHAPTMRMPAQLTSVEKIKEATSAALQAAIEYEFASMAIPGMGTGVGRVPVAPAAKAMIEAVKGNSVALDKLNELILVDTNKEMVTAWEQCWHDAGEDSEEPPE